MCYLNLSRSIDFTECEFRKFHQKGISYFPQMELKHFDFADKKLSLFRYLFN